MQSPVTGLNWMWGWRIEYCTGSLSRPSFRWSGFLLKLPLIDPMGRLQVERQGRVFRQAAASKLNYLPFILCAFHTASVNLVFGSRTGLARSYAEAEAVI